MQVAACGKNLGGVKKITTRGGTNEFAIECFKNRSHFGIGLRLTVHTFKNAKQGVKPLGTQLRLKKPSSCLHPFTAKRGSLSLL